MNHLIRLSGHRESEIGVVFSGLRLEGESLGTLQEVFAE